jgi:hypothetical protein
MFRRNKDNDEKSPAKEDENLTAPPLKPFSKRGTHAPSKPSTPAYRPEVARHVVEIPGSPRRAESNGSGSYGDRKLVVGKEICLNGKITSCDTLVVEGEVEASLTDARLIDVANTGSFRGSATVDEAVINGRWRPYSARSSDGSHRWTDQRDHSLWSHRYRIWRRDYR